MDSELVGTTFVAARFRNHLQDYRFAWPTVMKRAWPDGVLALAFAGKIGLRPAIGSVRPVPPVGPAGRVLVRGDPDPLIYPDCAAVSPGWRHITRKAGYPRSSSGRAASQAHDDATLPL